MKISVAKKKWATTSHQRCCQKLANHVMSHYPKDTALHKAVRESFKSMDAAATKLAKSSKKASPARRRKTTARRRTTARKRTARGPAKRTARRAAPKRRTTARRRTTRRRTA